MRYETWPTVRVLCPPVMVSVCEDGCGVVDPTTTWLINSFSNSIMKIHVPKSQTNFPPFLSCEIWDPQLLNDSIYKGGIFLPHSLSVIHCSYETFVNTNDIFGKIPHS